jgi:hypothetical protein
MRVYLEGVGDLGSGLEDVEIMVAAVAASLQSIYYFLYALATYQLVSDRLSE